MIFSRGLLHPFGVSFFIIVEKVCTKAQDLDLDLDHDHGPIGSVTKKIGAFLKSALPFIYAVQYQWLILLTFVDDHIIVVVNMLTTIFPPSKRLFNKIDRLIDAVETDLPAKFDNAMNKFPVFPFLHWVLTTCIAWMNFLIPTFTQYWRSSNDTWEKEIMVDINCENCNDNESQNDDHCENLERSSALLKSNNACKVVNCSAQCDDSKTSIPRSDQEANMKCSYKEILEKGKKESAEKKEDCVTDENPETYFSTDEAEEKDGNGSNENIVSEDPILELFEASWHMNPTKGSSFPTSYSFT